MEDSTVLILVISVFALIAGGTGLYFLLRFLRGTIKISLPVTTFSPGDVIRGSFELHAKKAVSGKRLIVTLIGTRHERRRDKDGKSESRSQEIFRKEVVVEEARDYPAGFKESYQFELPIPDSNRADSAASDMLQNIVSAANMLSNRRVEIRWKPGLRLRVSTLQAATRYR